MNASCFHRLYYYGIGWGGKPTGKAPKPPTSIENLRSNFSHAGEFCYDRAAVTIEYIFRAGETLATLEATATTATKQEILIVNNTKDVAWRDVKFEYATWLGSSGPMGFVDTQSAFIYGGGHNEAWGGDTTGGEPPVNLHVVKSQKVKFSGCSFSHLGAVYALGGDGGSQDLVVFNSSFADFNSSFADCSGGGIKLGYSGERSLKSTAHNVTLDPSLQDRGFLISDNTMEGIPCEYTPGLTACVATAAPDATVTLRRRPTASRRRRCRRPRTRATRARRCRRRRCSRRRRTRRTRAAWRRTPRRGPSRSTRRRSAAGRRATAAGCR